jgi:hypothetical protein
MFQKESPWLVKKRRKDTDFESGDKVAKKFRQKKEVISVKEKKF